MSITDVLKHSKTIDVLLALLDRDMPIKELCMNVGGSFSTVYKAVAWLEHLSLVEKTKHGRRIKIALTPRGYEFAKALQALDLQFSQ